MTNTAKTTKVAKAKRSKTDKVSPNVARIQRQLGATLLPW